MEKTTVAAVPTVGKIAKQHSEAGGNAATAASAMSRQKSAIKAEQIPAEETEVTDDKTEEQEQYFAAFLKQTGNYLAKVTPPPPPLYQSDRAPPPHFLDGVYDQNVVPEQSTQTETSKREDFLLSGKASNVGMYGYPSVYPPPYPWGGGYMGMRPDYYICPILPASYPPPWVPPYSSVLPAMSPPEAVQEMSSLKSAETFVEEEAEEAGETQSSLLQPPQVDQRGMLSRAETLGKKGTMRRMDTSGKADSTSAAGRMGTLISMPSMLNRANTLRGTDALRRKASMAFPRQPSMSPTLKQMAGKKKMSKAKAVVKRDKKREPDIGCTPWIDIEHTIALVRGGYGLTGKPSRQEDYPQAELDPPHIDDAHFPYRKYRPKYYREKPVWPPEIVPRSGRPRLPPEGYPKPSGASPLAKKTKEEYDASQRKLGVTKRPYQSLSEAGQYFIHLEADDQDDTLRLLMLCTKLEKDMEEQYKMVDVLETDLTVAQQKLKFPADWCPLDSADFTSMELSDKPFLPTANVPLFLKGRVSLLPNQVPDFPTPDGIAAAIAAKGAKGGPVTMKGATKIPLPSSTSTPLVKPGTSTPPAASKPVSDKPPPPLPSGGPPKPAPAPPAAGKTPPAADKAPPAADKAPPAAKTLGPPKMAKKLPPKK